MLCLCDILSGYYSEGLLWPVKGAQDGSGTRSLPWENLVGAGLSTEFLVSSMSGLGSYTQLGGF